MNSRVSTLVSSPASLDLERILHSSVFRNAHRSQRFLRYLVEAATVDPPRPLKEYTIAVDVFDRGSEYDPAVDATVRVEAGRLRSRLRDYYVGEGRDDSVVVAVPKGSYAAVISRRPVPPLTAAELPQAPLASAPLAAASAAVPHPAPRPRAWRGAPLPWIAAAVVLVACAALGWMLTRRQIAPRPVPGAPVSLAILPIVNRTGEPRLDPVADGLTGGLIRQLSDVPALRLIARASVFHYRQRTQEPRLIAHALGVANVMTGELRRVQDAGGSHLVLQADLSTADGSVLLSREYNADGDDLQPVQASLLHDLLSRLHVEGSALDPNRHTRALTSSPQAFQEFLAGDGMAQGGSPGELHQAIDSFAKAVALDPGFDLAWSGLASAHALLGLYYEAPRDHMPLARGYAQRALRLNPALGEAHGTLGIVYLVYDWNIPAAEDEMRWAGAQQAALSTLSCTAHLIERTGEPREAEQMLARMLPFDPESAALIAELGCVEYYRGHYEAALQHYRRALAASPRSPVPYWGLGKTLNALGRYGEAVAVMRSFRERNGFQPPLLTAEIGYALGSSGQRDGAREAIRELTSAPPGTFVDPYLVSLVYASMKDREQTFRWLERALEVRSSFMISLPTERKWEPFRTDPRFARIVDRVLQGSKPA